MLPIGVKRIPQMDYLSLNEGPRLARKTNLGPVGAKGRGGCADGM